MGLRKEHSVLQLLYEGFFLESRSRVGYPLYEGFFSLKPDNMGKALSYKFQQMKDVASNLCLKPMSYSKREPSTF